MWILYHFCYFVCVVSDSWDTYKTNRYYDLFRCIFFSVLGVCAYSCVCLPTYVGRCTWTCFCVHVEVRGQSQMSFLGSCQHCILKTGLSLTWRSWSRSGFLASKYLACLPSVVIICVCCCMWVLCKDLRSSYLCQRTLWIDFFPLHLPSVLHLNVRFLFSYFFFFAIWDLDFFYFIVKRIAIFWYNNVVVIINIYWQSMCT